jgi:hypothetical protein
MVEIRHGVEMSPTDAAAWLRPSDWNDPHVITGSLGGGSSLERTLSSAEILALHTTPITLLAAQPDTIWIPIRFMLVYRHGGVSYTGGGSVEFLWLPSWSVISTNLLTSAGDAFDYLFGTSGVAPLTTFENAAFAVRRDGAAFAAGNGTLEITLDYQELAV